MSTTRPEISLRFVGSGDAFGSGGRFQTCIAVERRGGLLLLDCGATSLVAMRKLGIDPGAIDAIVLSHFHADHFGGIPFIVLDAQFSRRSRPLVIAGPRGVEARVRGLLEATFPGSSSSRKPFTLEFVELGANEVTVANARVRVVPVVHTPGSEPHGLRVEAAGKTIAYSGDTEWTDALIGLADGADVFVCEAYSYDKPIRYHLSFAALATERERLRCARLVLTHFGPEMLGNLERARVIDAEVVSDGDELSW